MSTVETALPTTYKGFKVGDRIVENGNNPDWGCTLDSLIRHGEIIDFRHVPGCAQEEKHPFVRYDDGSEGFVIWEQMHPDTVEIPTTPPWKDESAEALLEVAKALSSPCTDKVVNWVITAEEELNKIQQQIDKCCLGQDKAKGELKKALKEGHEAAEKEFIEAIIKYSNEATALGLTFSFQSFPEGERNHLKVYVQRQTLCTEAVDTSPEFFLGNLIISFAKTLGPLLQGKKSVTRRIWKDSHVAKFLVAWDNRQLIRAFDKDPGYKGKQIGWLKLTQEPYQEPILQMPHADLAFEGGMCQTVGEFVDKYFDGNNFAEPWVVRFQFLPMSCAIEPSISYEGRRITVIETGQTGTIFANEEGKLRVKADKSFMSASVKCAEFYIFADELGEVWDFQEAKDSVKEPITEWTENSRAIYKGEPCQVIQLGTGSYRNKAKITTADFEEKWVPLHLLVAPSSSTNSSAELAGSVREQESPGDSPSETTSILTPQPLPSTDTITLPLPSTQIFAPITQTGEVMPMRSDSLAPAHQVRVLALDSITPNPVFGLKPCDASSKGTQTLWSLKTLKVLSTEDYGKFLEDSEWLDIRGTIRNSYRQLGSELLTGETDSSLLPTPTSYAEGSDTHRPAGTNKLEKALKLLPTVTASTGGVIQDLSKGGNRLERSLLPTPVARDGKGPTGTPNESLTEPIQEYLTGTDKMNPAVPGWMMGFQLGYVEKILMAGGETTQLQLTQASLPEQKNDAPVSNSTAEASCPSKLRSHSAESSTSTQSLEIKVMVQSAERTTPSIKTQNLEERIFAILPEDGTDWKAEAAISRELDVPLTTVLEALDKLGKAKRAWSKGDKWCRKSTQKGQALDRYIESRIASEGEDSAQTEYPRVEKLNPDEIILNCGTQSRLKEDEEQIHYYKEAMECGDWDFDRRPLPEVLLAPDGKLYPIDCHHRVKAMILSLHAGRVVPFLVHKGTLAQARIWSTTANTKNGLGADESPQGVRKRIEMFLDGIAELSDEEYAQEFAKVPDLTPREKTQGKFSSRTIARYLRLRNGQDRTVSNIMKERELAAKISQFFIGDRVEVVFAPEIEEDKRPKGFTEGDAGTIHDKDTKLGLWVKWDKQGGADPFPINPDFVKPSTQPKPKPVPVNRTSTPTSITGSTENGGSVTFTGKAQESRVLPDMERNEDETAQEERTPSPIPPGLFQSGSKVRVTNPNTVFYGRQGIITSFPNNNDAIVELEATDTEPATKERIAQRDLTRESTPVMEVRKSPLVPVMGQSNMDLVSLVSAVRTVVDNLHLLKPEELAALEDAIAQAKRSWSEAA